MSSYNRNLFVKANLLISAFTLLIGASLPISNALAIDWKITPGNLCHGRSNSHENNITHWWDYVSVSGTATRTLVCPTVRDYRNNGNGTYNAYIRVYAPTGKTVTCRLYSWNAYNTSSISRAGSVTGGGNRSINVDLSSSRTYGDYTVQCSVPPGGRIYNVYIGEFAGTDNH